MKRLFSISLALLMLCTLCGTVFASEITTDSNQSSNVTVQYGVDSGYIITIPDRVDIDGDTSLGSITVSASNVMLPSEYALNVYIHGDSFENHLWHLTDVENAANKLGYVIVDAIGVIQPDNIVLNVEAGTAHNTTVSTTMELRLMDECEIAGTYTDMLTFSVSMDMQYHALSGTYVLNFSESEIASKALPITAEDAEVLNTWENEAAICEYFVDKYGATISPIVHHDLGNTYALVKATPMLRHSNGDVFYTFIRENENGESYAAFEWRESFFGLFAFNANQQIPLDSLLWLKQNGMKYSNNTEATHTIRKFFDRNLWYQGDISWLEWTNTYFYDPAITIQDGYVMYEGEWLLVNNDYVQSSDVMNGDAEFSSTMEAPQ